MLTYPKIGPDMYLTHWLLYYKPLRKWFQKKKMSRIGKNSEIRPFCFIDGTNNVEIGDNVIIPNGTILATDPFNTDGKIIIEDNVLLAPNCAIYCTTHRFDDITRPIKEQGDIAKTTIIKQGAWLGINSVVMPGVTVGRNAVVGANSVVTKNVPDYCVVVGSPARIIKNLKEENA
jgi:acetyltransferase-like isoleucine patch superfamily enzyme